MRTAPGLQGLGNRIVAAVKVDDRRDLGTGTVLVDTQSAAAGQSPAACLIHVGRAYTGHIHSALVASSPGCSTWLAIGPRFGPTFGIQTSGEIESIR